MAARVTADRARVLAYRRRVGALDRRLPAGADSLRAAALAGLQDSAPRAALLALHARVAGIGPDAWADPVFVQVWGPRRCVFVVAEADRALFTLGVAPDDPLDRAEGEALAGALAALPGSADGRWLSGSDLDPYSNALRLTGATGRVLIRWDGARRPDLRVVARPDADAVTARLALARRFLHVVGPATAPGFAWWAGLTPAASRAVFAQLAPELVAVRTPVGEAWLLAADEPQLRAGADAPAPARLLPSGDPFLMVGERDLLLPGELERAAAFPRNTVWPGAVMVRGELVGVWRRTGRRVTVAPWRGLTAGERAEVEAEAAILPLPGMTGSVAVAWEA